MEPSLFASVAVLCAVPYLVTADPTSTIPIISIAERSPTSGVSTVIGKVEKHSSNPLFVQDKPWEPRLDNGYPNVVFEPETGSWRCWYGDCVKGCGSQILLYANSTDGLVWDKPDLGMFDVKEVRPDLASIGTKNNIIMKGGGLGIYKDLHDKNASRRYKCFGEGCAGATGVAYSKDGLHFVDPQSLRFPAPQRYDCHNQVYWSPTANRYVLTTRDGFSGDPGRTIGMLTSEGDAFKFDTTKAPVCVEQGDAAHQLYSQITWEWHGVFLGIVMVYDATSKDGEVHCRLSWSPTADGPSDWQWVDDAGLTGGDFIPLGQGVPVPAPTPSPRVCSGWSPVLDAMDKSKTLSDCQAARAGHTSSQHTICGAQSSHVGDMTLTQCQDACSKNADCEVIQWQGEAKNQFASDKPGQCFLHKDDCLTSQKPYSTKISDTFCMEILRCSRAAAGDGLNDVVRKADLSGHTTAAAHEMANDFDSHVCFAAASPVLVDATHRIYYMGGNGPHSGDRNSSFALATLGKDRFAGLAGTGSFTTRNVTVAGNSLLVTADVEEGGSLSVGLMTEGLTPADSTPFTGNVTDAAVAFTAGKTLAGLRGKEVAVVVELKRATIFTIGFGV